MNIALYLQRTATANPNAPAVYSGTQLQLNYGELLQRTTALAGYLKHAFGVKPGDRVAIYAANCVEYLEILHAILWIGAVSVPVNYKLHNKELDYVLADCEARVLIVSQALSACTDNLANPPAHILIPGSPEYGQALQHAGAPMYDCGPDELASLFYTSGTTGRPKGVMQSHGNLQAMTVSYLTDVDTSDPADVMVYAAPMSHGAGLYNYVHMLSGARHLVPLSGGFEPAELAELAASMGRLTFFAAPTMVKRLLDYVIDSGADVSGFKTIVYGGGPMYVEDIQQALQVFGPRFVQIYGQGECPMAITALARHHLADVADSNWKARIASVGLPQSMVEVRVINGNGESLDAGEIGEVAVRGAPVMQGYWRNEEATRKTVCDGWLLTGDTGFLDANGFLTLHDRSKDLIISGGSNIYPREVEEVLLTHANVSEVAVVGQLDAEWGEVPVAFVVTRKGCVVEPEELDQLCLNNLARFKRPKHYHVISALPKNSYGKVLKTELRQRLSTINI